MPTAGTGRALPPMVRSRGARCSPRAQAGDERAEAAAREEEGGRGCEERDDGDDTPPGGRGTAAGPAAMTSVGAPLLPTAMVTVCGGGGTPPPPPSRPDVAVLYIDAMMGLLLLPLMPLLSPVVLLPMLSFLVPPAAGRADSFCGTVIRTRGDECSDAISVSFRDPRRLLLLAPAPFPPAPPPP